MINDETVEEIETMVSSGVGIDEAADQIMKKTRLAPDLIKYIAKSKITV